MFSNRVDKEIEVQMCMCIQGYILSTLITSKNPKRTTRNLFFRVKKNEFLWRFTRFMLQIPPFSIFLFHYFPFIPITFFLFVSQALSKSFVSSLFSSKWRDWNFKILINSEWRLRNDKIMVFFYSWSSHTDFITSLMTS